MAETTGSEYKENICSLAVQGEHLVHSLLLNIMSIIKHLKTLQSDPVLIHQVISPQPLTATPNQTLSAISSLNIDPLSSDQSSDDPLGSSSNSINNLSLNLQYSLFNSDNEKVKQLDQQCISYLEKLKIIILKIVCLEKKSEESKSLKEADPNELENELDQLLKDDSEKTSSINELEKLKLEAYEKNCIIKKLIDNMRLLQLSINTMNRVSMES
eukprot:gene6816-8455_t